MEIFISTIIPTINRSSLTKTVESVLIQNFDAADFEVIVVNDSGIPLPSMEWLDNPQVKVVNTIKHERSVARNTGAAIAKGEYFHFLDDDDCLLPDAFAAFWDLSKATDACWLTGSYITTDNDGNTIQDFYPETIGNIYAPLVAGESIPFQVSLIQRSYFFRAGGFDIYENILGVEDRDLGRRLGLIGTVAYTNTPIAKIRIGEQGSTTNWETIAESDRWGREKVLQDKRTVKRLRHSAGACTSHGIESKAYWYGRICQSFIASAAWNLRNMHISTTAYRIFQAASFTGIYMSTAEFWRGVNKIPIEDRKDI